MGNVVNLIPSKPDAKSKGLRIREARKATFLGLKAFAQKYGFNYGTLKSWEHGLHGGLPPRRASEIVEALQNEGINCSVEWLIYGNGEAPSNLISFISSSEKLDHIDNEQQRINKELEDFYLYYQNATHLIVDDDALYPAFLAGDIVAGVKKYTKDVRTTINLDCIVQIENEKQPLLRNVCQGSKKDLYTLICKNPNTSIKQTVLYDVRLISSAPVIWLRRESFK